jgi:hypothetical protein
MKTVRIWGPWNDNPSKKQYIYGINESTKLEPNLGGEIDMDTHKLLDKDENKDDDELTGFDEEITEEVKESSDPYASILKDLK